GLGPILEEDIAFSSIAQDKIGQSLAIYNILHSLGESEPDIAAFTRNAGDFKSCRYVEYPIGEYDFSLVRNFFFNHAESIRFDLLSKSCFEPVAKLAKKLKGEIKYHVMHADTWINQLGKSGGESNDRLQKTINESFSHALGIFEPGEYENVLIDSGIFEGEEKLKQAWIESVTGVLIAASLSLPDKNSWKPVYGGRKGIHTEHLQPLIDEMGEVFRIDPKAEW
ncbi:MAG: 1,2-phenylacetyl-CoA epoxidase subunit PaaC, partial [Ignavibacteria bacterium]